jgi:hypothetical protein
MVNNEIIANFRILYTSDEASYTSEGSFSVGTICNTSATSALSPIPQSGPASIYSVSEADASNQGSWFPGTPCSVNVTSLGCYLAWSNDTHYFEEGNYIFPNLSYAANCPNCSRPGPSSDGVCSNDGSLSCVAETAVNYRCMATRVLSSTAPPSTAPPTSQTAKSQGGGSTGTPPGTTNSAGAATDYKVKMSLLLSTTLAEFTASVQQSLKEQLALAASLTKADSGRVALAYAAAARRLLAGVAVNATVSVADQAAATKAAAGLGNQTNINALLSAAGLPQATITAKPTIELPAIVPGTTPKSAAPARAPGSALALLAAVLAAAARA